MKDVINIVCSHKRKGPWVLLYLDKTYSKYVCARCDKKMIKK
jgi:hypothetical protein